MFLRTPQATSQPQHAACPMRALHDLTACAGVSDTLTRRLFRRLSSILAQRTG